VKIVKGCNAMPDAKRSALSKSQKRVRLAPSERQTFILDHVAEIVARDGVSALSMDRIGREAGISKSLVYNYFPNITDLLRLLLQREWRRLRRQQVEAAQKANTFEDLVRSVTHVYLKYIDERGMLIVTTPQSSVATPPLAIWPKLLPNISIYLPISPEQQQTLALVCPPLRVPICCNANSVEKRLKT